MASISVEDMKTMALVANEQSVSRAARRLGVTQQSVSERVRRLEERVGKKLFVRQAHGMALSPAGYRLLPYARRAVELMEDGLAAVQDEDMLRVLVQRTVASAVAPFQSRLASRRAEVELVDDAQEILAALSAGRADVGLGAFVEEPAPLAAPAEAGPDESSPGPQAEHAESNGSSGLSATPETAAGAFVLPPAKLSIETLFSDPIVWVVPPGHPLAQRSGVSLDELSAPMGPDGAEAPRVVARSVVAGEIASGELVELRVDSSGWVIPVSIAFRASDSHRPAVVSLRDVFAETRPLEADLSAAPPFSEVRR